MARLQLDAEDLAKVRMSSSWGPFNEALLSLHVLRDRRPNVLVDGWRPEAQRNLGEWAAPLLALIPRHCPLDLHTVVGDAPSLGQALEVLEGAPTDHLRSELAVLAPELDRPGAWVRTWWRDLSDGNREARRELAGLITKYHESAVAPHWRAIDACLAAERARCSRIMTAEGVGRLLDSLHPQVRWRPPFLDVGVTRGDGRDVPVCTLGGRSLLLVPSVFCVGRPWVMWNTRDETSPYLLEYPVLRSLGDAAALWIGGVPPGAEALSRLLGPTRASALDAVADPCNTSELARRLGVSPATASHHAGVLRAAKLISSRRDGGAVQHHLTGLGAALLDGDSVV